ncbi:hypothetical protein P4O66_003953 [Electrophorus voltai]|uniref:Integrase catalytic domain-containing protein n=1 Tax=Electrophorus voltai TaxID=2609070 RepID=A0AAD8YQK2_9TELE|nr:hypothetical protein P4O66_003953 [Electrophorus voltai]
MLFLLCCHLLTSPLYKINISLSSVSSTYLPESQGALERFHQTLKSKLRTFCLPHEKDWEVDLLLFLYHCITTWFGNCTVFDRKTLQRIVRTAEKIIGVSLPSITDIYTTRCIRKASSNVEDPTLRSHKLFTLSPSGNRYHSIWSLTSRLCNSFFPEAIGLLNSG